MKAPPRSRLDAPNVLTLIGLGAVASMLIGGLSAPRPILLNPGLIAHETGMLAGFGVAVMLMLMARIPALEHGVGADRIARCIGSLTTSWARRPRGGPGRQKTQPARCSGAR